MRHFITLLLALAAALILGWFCRLLALARIIVSTHTVVTGSDI